MFVYLTDRFRSHANEYSGEVGIDRLLANISRSIEISRPHELAFSPMPPCWIRNDNQFRTLARIVRVDSHSVLCVLGIIKWKDPDFRAFVRDRDLGAITWLNNMPAASELRQFIDVAQRGSAHPVSLPPLPEALFPWLEPPRMHLGRQSILIYESDEWVRRFQQRPIDEFWQTYYELVSAIVQEGETTQMGSDVQVRKKDRCAILFAWLLLRDQPGQSILFLIAPFRPIPDAGEVQLLLSQAAPTLFNRDPRSSGTGIPQVDILPYARRAYPYWLLGEPTAWHAIQQHGEANLALSPEEEELLHSVEMPTAAGGGLPVFINGRAGSGKSTILARLFADYCHRKVQLRLPHDPLYLTYSQDLKDVAKKSVRDLLVSNHRFVADSTLDLESLNIDRFFHTFRLFLLSLLPANERASLDNAKFISFPVFKQLYCGEAAGLRGIPVMQLPQGRRWSPEMAWHVIRTYIKGYQPDTFLTPEDYVEKLPRKERTVGYETFRDIHDTIWKRWYQEVTSIRGCWDDQDLIRRVLSLRSFEPKYAAIFCDEAQDFTRVELQLLMRLSVLSQYETRSSGNISLPFAFAGDPFQTLNPTGFRWSNLQAAFFDEVLASIEPEGSSSIKLNLRQLTYNYRSTPSIVQFTNVIQLWRRALFDMEELEPQMWWQKSDEPQPSKFILGKNINPETLRDLIANTIIIVPCEEGQEHKFICEDDALSGIFPAHTDCGCHMNVRSAIRAKGLEFRRVIVYKFGDKLGKNLDSLLDEKSQDPERLDQMIELQYFFNKLYVATTRAMNRLFILDSEDGDNFLWRFASESAQNELLTKMPAGNEWRRFLGSLNLGSPASATEMTEDNPAAVAAEFESKGINLSDPELMRAAKQYHKLLGRDREAAICEAFAMMFEGQFERAGKQFEALGRTEEARACFWDGECWTDFKRIASPGPRLQLASFMAAAATDKKASQNFLSFLEDAFTEETADRATNQHWRNAGSELAKRAVAIDPSDFDQSTWQLAGVVLEELSERGYVSAFSAAALCYYRSNTMSKAIHCWELASGEKPTDYYIGKADLIGLPDGLKWLQMGRLHERALAEWVRAGSPRDRAWLLAVAPSLESLGRYWEAIQAFVELDLSDRVAKNLKGLLEEAPAASLINRIVHVVKYMTRRQLWNQFLEFHDLADKELSGRSKADLFKFRCQLVRDLAYSDLVPEDLNNDQNERYAQIVQGLVSSQTWQRHVTFRELGCALERIGNLLAALRFYERFLEDVDSSVAQSARERWVLVKQRQADYFKRQSQPDRAESASREASNRCFDWDIRPDLLPVLPELQSPLVTGLPSSVKVQYNADGNVHFGLLDLDIRTLKAAKIATITDTTTLQIAHVDIAKGELTTIPSLSDMKKVADGDSIVFALPKSRYIPEIHKIGATHELHLRIQGYDDVIILRF